MPWQDWHLCKIIAKRIRKQKKEMLVQVVFLLRYSKTILNLKRDLVCTK